MQVLNALQLIAMLSCYLYLPIMTDCSHLRWGNIIQLIRNAPFSTGLLYKIIELLYEACLLSSLLVSCYTSKFKYFVP